jgi:thioredoxin 1
MWHLAFLQVKAESVAYSHPPGFSTKRHAPEFALDFFIAWYIIPQKFILSKGDLRMASDNVMAFTDANFDRDVLQSDIPVLVDFWATWCAPCKAIAPLVDAVADENVGKIKVGKVNVDENQATPAKFNVRGIPTLILFKGGVVVEQIVGAVPKSQLEAMIAKAL